MNEMWNLIPALATGLSVGVIFFGGLWWTVRKAFPSKDPAVWLLGSLLLRMGLVLTAFYFVGRGQWERMLTCLIGFIIARVVVMRLTRVPEKPEIWVTEPSHES